MSAMKLLGLMVLGTAGLALWSSAASWAVAGETAPLIPREILFGNPDKAGVQISPDGKHISFLAPVDGVLNVWVGPIDDPDKAEPVTKDTHRGIRAYFWAYTNDHVLYVQDKDGDENWHVYSVHVDTKDTKDLTPIDGVQARPQQISHEHPEEILVGLNDRNPQLHDIYRVNIKTGEKELVQKNDGFVGFLTEDDMKVYFGMRMTPDGGMEVHRKIDGDAWTLFTTIPAADNLTTQPIGLDESGEKLYMRDSRGRDTAALTLVDIETQQAKVLVQDPKADVGGFVSHPTKNVIQAAASNYKRRKWHILDESIAGDFKALEKVTDGDFNITGRTKDDTLWTVAYERDAGPVRYYVYDRKNKKARFLFTNRKDLEGLPLSPMHPVEIEARDGLKLVSYYTLPSWVDEDGDGTPAKALPMVLFVHGGPWARDSWGYDSWHQWLANRGYAVLSVNYRGSTGFGKEFANAGDKEWARKMHDDLLDAVNWAVKKGIADKDEVAIMGGSYGGYATLVGLTFTPETFACGVDLVGPSNLITLLESIPPYWKPMIKMFYTRVGDPTTEEGRKLLKARSPLTRVEEIRRPLLIGQGANDPRVKQAESDQIVQAMKKRGIPVTYVLFPDEGHGFARPENRLAFNAVAESFLSKHLGGRFEPMSEDLTAGSSVTIVTGAEGIPGLPPALKVKEKKSDDDT